LAKITVIAREEKSFAQQQALLEEMLAQRPRWLKVPTVNEADNPANLSCMLA